MNKRCNLLLVVKGIDSSGDVNRQQKLSSLDGPSKVQTRERGVALINIDAAADGCVSRSAKFTSVSSLANGRSEFHWDAVITFEWRVLCCSWYFLLRKQGSRGGRQLLGAPPCREKRYLRARRSHLCLTYYLLRNQERKLLHTKSVNAKQ
jgi:hypothetical protein